MYTNLLPHSLFRRGFSETVLNIQKYNVVRMTKYDMDDESWIHPLPINSIDKEHPEEIKVRRMVYSREDISVALTFVTFRGKDYPLVNIRDENSGVVLFVDIFGTENEYCGVWRFDTDTPSAYFKEVVNNS